MAAMPKRLPDELFRDQDAAESSGGHVDAQPESEPQPRSRIPFRNRQVKEFAPPMVVAGVVGALILGFGVGKLVAVQSDDTPSSPETTATSLNSPTAMPSPESTLGPWDGAVRTVPLLEAKGQCQAVLTPDTDPPSNLLDDDSDSRWSCRGPGVGETIIFTLEPGQVVVGVRLVNGNTSSPDRYLAERRILSVKWTFSDGSWVLQGLAANDRQPQEVRFPPTAAAGDVTMTVMDATVPGETNDNNDKVSISSLDFLGVA